MMLTVTMSFSAFNVCKTSDGNPSFLADHIVAVEAHDDDTVSITLDNVRPSFLSELTSYAYSVTNADVCAREWRQRRHGRRHHRLRRGLTE